MLPHLNFMKKLCGKCKGSVFVVIVKLYKGKGFEKWVWKSGNQNFPASLCLEAEAIAAFDKTLISFNLPFLIFPVAMLTISFQQGFTNPFLPRARAQRALNAGGKVKINAFAVFKLCQFSLLFDIVIIIRGDARNEIAVAFKKISTHVFMLRKGGEKATN